VDGDTVPGNELNTARYHRWFKLGVKGAMGLTVNHRGYHDENMWVAHTDQPAIMPLSIKHKVAGVSSWAKKRVSYALPLEIIYSTPLNGWNPYNLSYTRRDPYVTAGGRTGRDNAHAYNGTSHRHYYITPYEFYAGSTEQHDPADTARTSVKVADPKGQVHDVSPAGFRVLTQKIAGVGSVRQRYPIFPVHSEGTTVGEEVAALKDMVMDMGNYQYLYRQTPLGQPMPTTQDVHFHVRDSARNPPGLHGHDFTLTQDEFKALMNGTETAVTTSFNLGHQHQLKILWNARLKRYEYTSCDGGAKFAYCWDRHSRIIVRTRDTD